MTAIYLWLDAHFGVVNQVTCIGGSLAFFYGVFLAFVVSPWFLLLLLLSGLAAATNAAAFHGQTLRFRIEDEALFAKWRRDVTR